MTPIAAGSARPGIATAQSPAINLPLRFLVAGPVALVLAYAALAVDGRHLLQYYLLPADLAVTHLLVLGWITMVMNGALYQLAPVVFRTRLYSERLGRWQFALFATGVAGMVFSFSRSWVPGLPVFGMLTVGAVLLFLYNLARTLVRATVWTITGRYLLHSLVFFALTVATGLTFALDLQFHWFAIPRQALAAHVHLGVVGWLGLTLMGVSYQLIPMFALVEGHGERLAHTVLWTVSIGAVLVALSLLLDLPGPTFACSVAVLASGVLGYAVDVARMFRLRRRRRLDLTQQHTIASTLSMLATLAVGLRLAINTPSGAAAQTHWFLAYGYLALGGWLTLAIMGQYYKILPFLVWQTRYSSRIGREPVPLLRELYREGRARVAFYLYLIGFAGISVSLLGGWERAVPLAALPAAAGSLGFAWTLVETLGRHRAVDHRRSKGEVAALP